MIVKDLLDVIEQFTTVNIRNNTTDIQTSRDRLLYRNKDLHDLYVKTVYVYDETIVIICKEKQNEIND